MLSRYPALLMAAALFLPRPVDATPRDRMLVSASWLKAHLSDPGLVLLQVGERAEYDREHIPGARYLQLRAISDRSANGLSLEMLPITALDSALAALGVTAALEGRDLLRFRLGEPDHACVADDWSTRAWAITRSSSTGDCPHGRRQGYAVTAEVPAAPNVTRLVTTADPGVVVNAEWVQARLTQPRFRLIDARDPQFYQGLDAGSGTRPGHLPGARSIPFTSVTDEAGRFLPDSALRRIFREAGVSQGDEIVAYCHIGQQATAVVFAAQLLGYNAKLYDGSFEDWTRHDALPVEGAVAATRGALISTDQLASRLATDSITVVDLRSDLNAYLADHLPGAVYLHYENLRVSAKGVPAGVLPQSAYAEIWSRIGIRRDRPVVIYASGDAQNFNATFLAWLLAGFRQSEVYVLDGGYAKWAAEGKTLTPALPRDRDGEVQQRPLPARRHRGRARAAHAGAAGRGAGRRAAGRPVQRHRGSADAPGSYPRGGEPLLA